MLKIKKETTCKISNQLSFYLLVRRTNEIPRDRVCDHVTIKSQSCNNIAREIWQFARDHNLWLSVSHILQGLISNNVQVIFNINQ